MGTRNSHPLLTAITGEQQTLPDGSTMPLRGDNPKAHFAVMMPGADLGPLSQRDARPLNAYVGVRIRGIYRHRSYGYRRGGFGHE